MVYVPVKDPVNGRFIKSAYVAKRARTQAKVALDGESQRYFRNARHRIARKLTAALERQGRVIHVVLERQIGAAAYAGAMCEIVRAKREMGEPVHEDLETKWLNTEARALLKLGLKANALAPKPVKPVRPLSSMVSP